MGNRAVIVFQSTEGELSPAIYLQWNGGPESIYAFLSELQRRNVRNDHQCAAPRFCQLVGEYFDFGKNYSNEPRAIDSLSLYMWNSAKKLTKNSIQKLYSPAEYDNGLYIISYNGDANNTGTNYTVRRFVFQNKKACVELTPEEVKQEYEQAITDKKYTGILESFLENDHGRTYQIPQTVAGVSI